MRQIHSLSFASEFIHETRRIQIINCNIFRYSLHSNVHSSAAVTFPPDVLRESCIWTMSPHEFYHVKADPVCVVGVPSDKCG